MDLFGRMLFCRLGFVETCETAIVALVQSPVLGFRNPEPAETFQRVVQCADRAGLVAGEGGVEGDAGFSQQRARAFSFRFAFFCQVCVPPSSETCSRDSILIDRDG